MLPNRKRTTTKPGILGWGFALLSVALASGVGVLGLSTAKEQASVRTFERLSQELTSGRFAHARLTLLEWRSAASRFPFADVAARERRSLALEVAGDLAFLAEQAGSQKAAAFEAARDRAARGVVSLSNQFPAALAAWEKISPQLDEQTEETKRLSALQDEAESLKQQKQPLIDQYNELGQRFSKLLSLGFEPVDSTGEELPVYKSGVFVGIPVLSKIPDGMPDLIAVRSHIERRGGSVRVTGPNAHEEFLAELESIQALTGAVMSGYDSQKERGRDLQRQLSELRGHVTARAQRLRPLLSAIVLQLSKPPPSWSSPLFNYLKGA